MKRVNACLAFRLEGPGNRFKRGEDGNDVEGARRFMSCTISSEGAALVSFERSEQLVSFERLLCHLKELFRGALQIISCAFDIRYIVHYIYAAYYAHNLLYQDK